MENRGKPDRLAAVRASFLVVALAAVAGPAEAAVVTAVYDGDHAALPARVLRSGNPEVIITLPGKAPDWRRWDAGSLPLRPAPARPSAPGTADVPSTDHEPALPLDSPREFGGMGFPGSDSIWYELGRKLAQGAARNIDPGADPDLVRTNVRPYLSALARSASQLPAALPMFVSALAFAAVFSLLRHRHRVSQRTEAGGTVKARRCGPSVSNGRLPSVPVKPKDSRVPGPGEQGPGIERYPHPPCCPVPSGRFAPPRFPGKSSSPPRPAPTGAWPSPVRPA